jgi:predicted alpha/beta hydrolase
VTSPDVDTIEILADDGVHLAIHRSGDPAGIPVVLVPGTFSNHTFWLGTRGTGFAGALAAAGYHPWVLDPRGHGLSQKPARGERWDFDDWARRDVPAAVHAAARLGRGVILIGHSAGGATALIACAADAAVRDHVRGVVVVATPVPWLQAIRRALTRLVLLGSTLLDRFPARLVGLGPEDELGGVMAQWMTWNLRGRWTGDDGTDYEERLRALALPALFIAGGGDRVEAPPAAVHALFKLVGSRDKTFLLCGRDGGFSQDFDHVGVLVSRAARAEVWPKIIEWLDRTLR